MAPAFLEQLKNAEFKACLMELVEYGLFRNTKYYGSHYQKSSFSLYQKYSFEDVIFNDRQLEDLINQKPRTLEELQRISGFGPVKTEKYGPGILALINPAERMKAPASNGNQNQPWSPAQLVGEKITHQTFGSGTVKSVSRHEIIIKFPMTARSFTFPDVFDTTIWLSNPALQKKVEELIKA